MKFVYTLKSALKQSSESFVLMKKNIKNKIK